LLFSVLRIFTDLFRAHLRELAQILAEKQLLIAFFFRVIDDKRLPYDLIVPMFFSVCHTYIIQGKRKKVKG